MVESVYNELTINSPDKDIRLRVGNLPDVKADSTLIRMVISNLLSNAIKYSSGKDSSEITVDFEMKEKEYIFYVADNGVGFDMQYVHKLYGVFQRLHSSREFEGNGVGLAIVQRVIQRHNGRVWAKGECGIGTTFYFTLPAAKEL